MKVSKLLHPGPISVVIVALFFAVALYLRVYLPYDRVFTGDWIKFTGTDAYYHMRIIDNLIHNFPHLMAYDPYAIYPGGDGVGNIRFFDWLLASIIWVIGLGSPTERTIDAVSVYFPAVLGALTVVPVYFIGRELFGRWAGVLSAGLVALLPGEFLGRSILGSTDHHVLETLLTTVIMLFLVLAIKRGGQRQLAFSHLRRRDWAASVKPLIYSLLAGIFMGIYIFTWLGAVLFAFIIFLYFIVQSIIDHFKGKSTDYLCLVGVPFFLVAVIISWLISSGPLYLVSMVVALLTPLVLSGISWLMTIKKMKPAYYPLTLVGLGLAGLGIFYVVAPSLLSSMLGMFAIFTPKGVALTTLEMQPLIPPNTNFFQTPAWGNFTTSFFIGLISILMLIYLIIKQGNAEKSLLVVWSLVMLAATVGQRRFAYYLAVNVALLTGYLSWRILELAGFKEFEAKVVEISPKTRGKRARPQKGSFHITISQVNMALALVIIFLVVFLPNIGPAVTTASQARFAPSDAWCSSLSWLSENTPDPFGNPNFYYHVEESNEYRSLSWLKIIYPNPSGDPNFYYQLERSYKYPKSAYGIMAWWDYGYWITRISHRIPNANPSQEPRAITGIANFLVSQDEKSADEIAQELGSAYIIIDYETATGKFWAIAMWAGREQSEFFDVYYVTQEDQLVSVPLFYPEYYRSLSTRLYNFDGKAVAPTPQSAWVISYQEMKDKKGNLYKVIDSATGNFTSYKEAEVYLLSQKSGNYKIVGTDPFISPVPLEALEHYRLIHSSAEGLEHPQAGVVPEVKIFEYNGSPIVKVTQQ